MNTYKLSNISLRDFRTFLFEEGCKRESIKGGHEKWTKIGLSRPTIIQTHIDPVPEHVVKSTLLDLGITRNDFFRKIYK